MRDTVARYRHLLTIIQVAQKVSIPKDIAKVSIVDGLFLKYVYLQCATQGVYTLHLQGTTTDGQSIGCAVLNVTF